MTTCFHTLFHPKETVFCSPPHHHLSTTSAAPPPPPQARRLNQVAKDEQLQLSAHELQQRRKEHGGEHGAEHAKAERT